MHRCMAKDCHTLHRHGASAARATSSSSRSECTIAAHASSRRKESCRRSLTQLLSGSIFLHRTFNEEWDSPSCTPRCTSGMRAVRSCRGAARGFGRRLLFFSEKQTFHSEQCLSDAATHPFTAVYIRTSHRTPSHSHSDPEPTASRNDAAATHSVVQHVVHLQPRAPASQRAMLMHDYTRALLLALLQSCRQQAHPPNDAVATARHTLSQKRARMNSNA